MSSDEKGSMDRWLMLFALLLAAVGMVWVYSATGTRHGLTFVLKQGFSGIIGVAMMLAFSRLDLKIFKNSQKIMIGTYVVFIIFLSIVFLFETKNGAHRWIVVHGYSIQPSEFFKLFSVILTSCWIVKCHNLWKRTQESILNLFFLFVTMAIPILFVYKEPDMGATLLIIFVSTLLIFLGGAPRWFFVVLAPVFIVAVSIFIQAKPYRVQRVQTFLNPTVDTRGSGYQPDQSLIAVGSGGLHGVGLGAGRQKLNFLPEAHTDFIFAIIGEEAGLIGTATVLGLFLAVLWRGCIVARRARDSFLRLCASGFSFLLVAQALVHMSVVLNILPSKGATLPFISYGGSSMMASFLCIGLLLSISREAA